VNLKTAAAKLGVHYQTAYKWIRTGELVAVKVAGGYEVSDDAIEQFRRRRAAMVRVVSTDDHQNGAVADSPHVTRDQAIETLQSMIENVDNDASVVWTTATRFCAEAVGDSSTFVLRDAATLRLEVVAFHHADPERLLLVASILGDGVRSGGAGFGTRALTSGEVVHLRHVSQLAVRQSVLPEYHQHLDTVGIYSVVAAPVRSNGRIVGVLSVFRDSPGNPLDTADRDFVVAVAGLVGTAMDVAEARRAARLLRRTLKEQLEHAVAAANGGDTRAAMLEVFRTVDAERSAAVLEPGGTVLAATRRYAAAHASSPDRLTGRPVESLLPDDEVALEAAQRARVVEGELDFAERTRRLAGDPADPALRIFEASVRHPDGRLVAIVETAAAP
jgi:excisionase family DNA binding protein